MNVLVPHGFEANYTLGLAKGLAAAGAQPFVVADDDTAPRLAAAGLAHANLRGSQSPRRSRWRKLTGLAAYYGRLLAFALRHRRVAVVHFSGALGPRHLLWDAFVLHPGLRLWARRYTYTVHNLLPHNRQHSRFCFWVYRFVYSLPDTLVVHSAAGKAGLTDRFKVPAAKIHVMPIGLNEEIADSGLTRDQARRRLELPAAEPLILCFGRIDEYKGIDLLIAAFGQLERGDARLLIAGPVRSDAYFRGLERQVAASPRRERIRIDPREIPNQEVEVLFKAADVLCLPYRNIYQSGLPFLAVRFGLPIVATNLSGFAEIVTPERGLLTATNDAAGLRDALEAFLRAPARYDRQAIAAGGAELRWDRIARGLVARYGSADRVATVPAAA